MFKGVLRQILLKYHHHFVVTGPLMRGSIMTSWPLRSPPTMWIWRRTILWPAALLPALILTPWRETWRGDTLLTKVFFRQFFSLINWMFRSKRSLFGIFFNWILYEVSQSLVITRSIKLSVNKSLFRAQKQFWQLGATQKMSCSWNCGRCGVAIVVLGVVGMKYDNKYADS